MFRAGTLFLILATLLASPADSKQPEIRAKQTQVSNTDTKSAQHEAPIPFQLLPSQGLWQPQQSNQTYQFNYYPEQQTNGGAEAFLGIGADLWVAIFTLFLVLATIVQAVLILRAEGLTRAALKVSQRQAARARVDAIKRNEETNAALATAQAANEISREMGRAQTRAYLVLRKAHLSQHVNGPSIEVEVANTGQSPAKWVEIEGNAQVIADLKTASHEIPLNPHGELKSRWPIDPGEAGRGYPFIIRGEKTLRELGFEAGYKKSLAIQGTLRWETVFGEIYESTFFFWIVPQPGQFKENPAGGLDQIPQVMAAPSNVALTTFQRVRDADAEED